MYGQSSNTDVFTEESSASFFNNFSAVRTSPVAEAYCSRQPFFPHPQHSVSSSFTRICPISPPAPFVPYTIFPSMIIPPPTPVPSVTITAFEYPSPPPFHVSPSAATLASFPTFVSSPVNSLQRSATLNTPHPRFTQRNTVPSSPTGPGTPIPRPATSSLLIPFSANFLFRLSAISGRICSP